MKQYLHSAILVAASLILASCVGSISEDVSKISGEGYLSVQEQSLDNEKTAVALYNPGEAIVKFTPEAAAAIENGLMTQGLEPVCAELGVVSLERVFPDAGEYEERTRREGLHLFYQVVFDDAVPYEKARQMFENIEDVEFVEGCLNAKTLEFNDPSSARQWAFNGTSNINAEYAWQYCTGDPRVVVCVVDHGIQTDHVDLAWNVGDTHYNFYKSSTVLNPGNHGTHVAGIIAAVNNNNKGISSIAGGNYAKSSRGVTLMSAQVFDGEHSAGSFARAIKWGADNGALISQNSWGYDYDSDKDGKLNDSEKARAMAAKPSETDKAAVDYFRKYAGCDNYGNQKADSPMKGGVVCFSSGNDGIANGNPGVYAPIIAVGATARTATLANYSNYGDWVDICAPGSDIYSTVTDNKYSNMSGTSMACPMVSGACALLVSYFGGKGFTNEDLEEILIKGAAQNVINYLAHNSGPFLDLKGSFEYGINKYKRQYNNNPVVRTEYKGEYVFRQYQNIDIPFIITDPDDDPFTVEAKFGGRGSLIQDVAVDSIWHFTLVGELVSDFTPKTATITVTDRYDGKTVYEFTYQVLKNNAPVVSGSMDDFIMSSKSDSRSIDLSGLFSDPDGEPLTISAKVSPQSLAEVSVEGDKLTVTPKAYGLATVTVSAVDLLREKAQTSFRFLVREGNSELEYYPNPVKDILHLRTGLQPESLHVRIFNSAGAKMFDGTVTSSAFEPGQVDMSSYAPGIYTLKVEKGGKNYEYSIVKK